jgi:hypothetical protein
MRLVSTRQLQLAGCLGLAAGCTMEEPMPVAAPAAAEIPAGFSTAATPYRYRHGDAQGRSGSVQGLEPPAGAHQVLVPGDGRFPLDAANMPGRLHPALRGDGPEGELRFDADAVAGPADGAVFASSWWPMSQNGIAHRWYPEGLRRNERDDFSSFANPRLRDVLSPVEKYDLLFHGGADRHDVPARQTCQYSDLVRNGENCARLSLPAHRVAGPATQWELLHHGNYQPQFRPDGWWGHCNGWASYAVAEAGGAPWDDVRVKLDDQGQPVLCGDEERDCILFYRGDIEALMSELYFSDTSTVAGRRCDVDPEQIERDEFGRPLESTCLDVNPATYHAAITGLLGQPQAPLTGGPAQRLAFVIDHAYGAEVWNFPVVQADILSVSEPFTDPARAMQLICQADQGTPACRGDYRFNPRAASFVHVETIYRMVSDSVGPESMRLRADERQIPLHEVPLSYLLELDGRGYIVGGEWTSDTGIFGVDNRELHPDFLWMPAQAQGWGEDEDDLGGNDDNPFISYGKVRKLLDLANRNRPVEQPRSEPRTGPVEQPRSEPRTGPVEQPRGEPRTGPVEQPRSEPRTGPVEQPRSEPRTGPVEQPRTGPVTGPVR